MTPAIAPSTPVGASLLAIRAKLGAGEAAA